MRTIKPTKFVKVFSTLAILVLASGCSTATSSTTTSSAPFSSSAAGSSAAASSQTSSATPSSSVLISSSGTGKIDLATLKVDKKTQPRVLITTDLEVDDMNGILLTLMHASDYDLAGIVWTAGSFHFSGNGKETFGEAISKYEYAGTKDYTVKCEGTTVGGTVAKITDVKAYRPADPSFLKRVIETKYAEDYKLLSQNNPNYPTPEYLLSIAKTGNISFEGDYREETEGSKLIYDAILDDDMRPLHIMQWGGINTTVRALQSIYETYHGTSEWDDILKKVVAKVRFKGTGEDNCWSYSEMASKFPGIVTSDDYAGPSGLGNYFMANTTDETPVGNGDTTLLPYYQSDYWTAHFKFNHGRVMNEYHLMNDGQALYGEPDCYQYGLQNYIDWRESWDAGFGTRPADDSPLLALFGRKLTYDAYDWMCCQFGTATFVDLGLRSDVSGHKNSRYTQVMFENLASRAEWSVKAPELCNHCPIASAVSEKDFTVAAGAVVNLSGKAVDPDGDALDPKWWVASGESSWLTGETKTQTNPFTGATTEVPVLGDVSKVALAVDGGWKAAVTIPAEAKSGSKFVVNLEVNDQGEANPMTNFVQFVITVA